MNGWEDFAIAEVGASAALAGLVLVGVSVNLERVLAEPSAPPRVAEALTALLALLVAATVLLVPDQRHWVIGAELLAVGATAWTIIVVLQRRAARAYAANHSQTLTGQERLLTTALVVLGSSPHCRSRLRGPCSCWGTTPGSTGLRWALSVHSVWRSWMPGRS
jgi:hypothetical protein